MADKKKQTKSKTDTLKIASQPYVSPYRNMTPSNMSNSQYGAGIRQLQQFNSGGTGFGAEALARARAGGMSDQDIRNAVFYGRYNVGEAAFNQLFGNNQRPSNTMSGSVLRNPDATVANVSGYGTQNWNTDTLGHMQERSNYLSSLGIGRGGAFNPTEAKAAIAAKGWQPSNSFAELGDQRWYSQPVTEDMRTKANTAAARSSRFTPTPTSFGGLNLMRIGSNG